MILAVITIDPIWLIVGFFMLILYIILIVKFFQIASDVGKLRSEIYEKVLLVNPDGVIDIENFRKISSQDIYIAKNPISGYFNVCVKTGSDKYRVFSTYALFEEAKEFALSKVKENNSKT